MIGRQQPFAHTVEAGQAAGSMASCPHRMVPIGQAGGGGAPPSGGGPTGPLPPAQKSTQAWPESPPLLF
jgi:hypothetical protein